MTPHAAPHTTSPRPAQAPGLERHRDALIAALDAVADTRTGGTGTHGAALSVMGDGSSRQGTTAAAAAMSSDGRWAAAALHTQGGSHAAELVGVALAYLLILEDPHVHVRDRLSVQSDSQSLIRVLQRRTLGEDCRMRTRPAFTALLSAVIATHAALADVEAHVELEWVRGHAEHAGNHAADAVARAVSWEVMSGRPPWGGVAVMADRLAVFARENWERITQPSALDLAMGRMLVAG